MLKIRIYTYLSIRVNIYTVSRKSGAKGRFMRFCFASGICSAGGGGKIKGITKKNYKAMIAMIKGDQGAKREFGYQLDAAARKRDFKGRKTGNPDAGLNHFSIKHSRNKKKLDAEKKAGKHVSSQDIMKHLTKQGFSMNTATASAANPKKSKKLKEEILAARKPKLTGENKRLADISDRLGVAANTPVGHPKREQLNTYLRAIAKGDSFEAKVAGTVAKYGLTSKKQEKVIVQALRNYEKLGKKTGENNRFTIN